MPARRAGVAFIVAATALLLGGCVGAGGAGPARSGSAPDVAAAGVPIRYDEAVKRVEPGPHDGRGTTTAYRYFDDLAAPGLVFRKRALHRGASIGQHVLTHDEVYYVLRGRGELTVDGQRHDVGPNAAIFMRRGQDVGIRQQGRADLVLIVAYPPAAP